MSATEFRNSHGDVYFIKRRKTKAGKTTYTITKTKSDDCVDEIPAEFEVYELPENGQLVIRRYITPKYGLSEVQLIRRQLDNNSSIEDYRIDIRGSEITIFISDAVQSEVFESSTPLLSMIRNKGFTNIMRRYSKMMKILLTEENLKEYEIQRICFRGSVDDWITIGVSQNLQKLAEKYLPHLGKDSFYELVWNYGE